jgi:hemerythrin-like metal-binding protein
LEQLILALAQGREVAETERALLLLGDYIEDHFKDEEALMDLAGYPGLTHHRAIHDGLRAQVKSLVETYHYDPRSIPSSVMEFLLSWLKEHLAGEDRLMADYLRQGRATSPQETLE